MSMTNNGERKKKQTQNCCRPLNHTYVFNQKRFAWLDVKLRFRVLDLPQSVLTKG